MNPFFIFKKKTPEPWIQTYSGKKFYPLNPREEDICIEDIAHSLSQLCRFTGHSQSFYSVAQHCVLVSSMIDDPKIALQGLLHDGSEYALQDIPSPLKKSGKFEAYKKYEHKLQSLIYKKYGCSQIEDPLVKLVDLKMLATESKDLMGQLHPDWVNAEKPYDFIIKPWVSKKAKKEFLKLFDKLYV